MKECNSCNIVKEDIEFYKRKLSSGVIGLKSCCKVCDSEKSKFKYKNETLEDRAKRKLNSEQWRKNNRDKVLSIKAKYRLNNKIYRLSTKMHDQHVSDYKDHMLRLSLIKYDQHVKEWRSDDARIYRWRYSNDINSMLYAKLKRGVYRALGNKATNSGWFDNLGYTIQELKGHLESQFLIGMSWDNRKEWHIDHMIPLCAFSIESVDSAEFKVCFALRNLRPVWPADNRNKYIGLDVFMKNNSINLNNLSV